MPELTDDIDDKGHLRLPTRLDMQQAPALRDWFLSCTGDVVLDASGVDVLTTPSLQVLMAGRDRLAKLGNSLSLTDPSNAFDDCLRVLGVSRSRLTTDGAGA